MSTTTLFQSGSHRRPPEELMIQDSSQHATVDLSTRQNTQRRSKLTQPHRSIVPTRNRPTHPKKNRSTVVQTIGRTTTATPQWQHTPETPCMQRSMMKIMRRNELQSTESFLMRKTNFYIIPLGKGMRHRSTDQSQHRSTLILIRQTENEHRPTLPTTHRSTLESTVYEKKTTRLAVGQMITITKAMQ